MKSAKSYLDDANKLVEKVSTEEAVALHGQGGVFVDVRDSADISTTGTIAGAVRIITNHSEKTPISILCAVQAGRLLWPAKR